MEPLLPGMFDPLYGGDVRELHQAGLDDPDVFRDAGDLFGNDPYLGEDPIEVNQREHLPQWGPQLIPYIVERFDALEEAAKRKLEKWQFEPVTVNFVAAANTGGGGGISPNFQPTAIIYRVPAGFSFALHRFSITFPPNATNNAGNPFTGALGYWELRVDDEVADFGSMVAGQGSIPVVRTWGTRDALHMRDGETLSFFMSAGPASQMLILKGQGTLDRTIEG